MTLHDACWDAGTLALTLVVIAWSIRTIAHMVMEFVD